MHRRTRRQLAVLALHGSIPNRIPHAEKHQFATLTSLGSGERRSRNRRRGDAGMFELSTSRYLVPAFLLIAGPPLCAAAVANMTTLCQFVLFFPVSLSKNSVDSGLLTVFTLCILTPPSPPPPPLPQCSGLTLLRVSFTPRQLNVKHGYINFKWHFICAC